MILPLTQLGPALTAALTRPAPATPPGVPPAVCSEVLEGQP
jgi:hypothetical protein